MEGTATAIAQAERVLAQAARAAKRDPAQTADVVQTLDDVARTLKRHHRETRELIQAVRRAQVTVLGVEVENTHGPQGGRSDIASATQDQEQDAAR